MEGFPSVKCRKSTDGYRSIVGLYIVGVNIVINARNGQ